MDKRYRYQEKRVHDISIEGTVVRVWNAAGAGDSRLIEQAFRPLLKSSFVYPYIALMPDYHPGKGVMVGSVIPTRNVILPSVMGGDLGCGMTALQLPINSGQIMPELKNIHNRIMASIPVGTAYNSSVSKRVEDNSLWQRTLRAPLFNSRVRGKLLRQFGSLGGGNHFLEIQEDVHGQVWVMLHSGSRNLGVLIRDFYVERGLMEEGIEQKQYAKLPYFMADTKFGQDYFFDMEFAVAFARESRREMMLRVLEVLALSFPFVQPKLIESSHDISHNCVAWEEHFGKKLYIHRKGATLAAKGQRGIIPGSMGSKSYIVEGRGNEYSFCSCSHGAGRAMSRGEAFRSISDRDFRNSMHNVMYQHHDRLRDESPLAYKDVQKVMRGQKDLVKIIYELHPLMSIKGIERAAGEGHRQEDDDS